MKTINYLNGYKIRLYPDKQQEKDFINHIGACRKLWNYFLRLEIDNYESGGKFIDHYDLNKKITDLKKTDEYKWLNEVSTSSLQIICGDLSRAFKRLFNKTSNFPKFKSKKKSKKSYPVCNNRIYFTDDGTCQIQKVGKVKFKTDLKLPNKNQKILDPRITKISDKWYLTFALEDSTDVEENYNECDSQAFEELPDKSLVGIDLGIKTLATVAFNDECITFDNINKSKRMINISKRINCIQKKLSRKRLINGTYDKSNNIIREEKKLLYLYNRQRNIRKNHIHQITNSIIKLNPNRVVMETLKVNNMMKNKFLSKSIQDETFGGFIETMRYKCFRHGIQFRQVPSNYPSSKTCCKCGHIKKDLKLNDRIYTCTECGNIMDRDYNAALNLMNYKF